MREAMARWLAGIAAVLAATALVVQFFVTIDHMTAEGRTVAAAVWRYMGLFTYYANGLVVAAAIGIASGREAVDWRRRLRLSAVTGSIMTGIIWTGLMQYRSTAAGIDFAAGRTLHQVVPVVFAAAWLLIGDRGLKWRDTLWVAVLPLAFTVYALIRGLADGWYPYWFVDAATLGFPRVAFNTAGILLAFLAMGLVLVAMARGAALLRSRSASEGRRDRI
jgi:hypothetical protein